MLKLVRVVAMGLFAVIAVGLNDSATFAQSPGGLLGVRVYESDYGLTIAEFTPGTSAAQLHSLGEIMVGDRMVRLNGRRLRCVSDVFAVTDQLHAGVDYAVLDLITRAGHPYQLYITPSKGGAPAACKVKTSRTSAPGTSHKESSSSGSSPAVRRPRD